MGRAVRVADNMINENATVHVTRTRQYFG